MTPITEAFEAWFEKLDPDERPDYADAQSSFSDGWRAATEAAAKKCDELGDFYMEQAREGDQSGASDHKACATVECADAVRGAL